MKLIRILLRHYQQIEITVDIKVTNLWTGKVEKMEGKGLLIKHIEDPSLIISCN